MEAKLVIELLRKKLKKIKINITHFELSLSYCMKERLYLSFSTSVRMYGTNNARWAVCGCDLGVSGGGSSLFKYRAAPLSSSEPISTATDGAGSWSWLHHTMALERQCVKNGVAPATPFAVAAHHAALHHIQGSCWWYSGCTCKEASAHCILHCVCCER